LPGYSAADNSTGPTAALGLLAHIVSGRGSQVQGSLRDVMLSQLNYRAAAYLNEGTEPRRVCTRRTFPFRSGPTLFDC
jgi:CoA:oxalate CoA-transferase